VVRARPCTERIKNDTFVKRVFVLSEKNPQRESQTYSLGSQQTQLDCLHLAGLVPYYEIGRAVRFRKAELDAALERMRMG